MDNFIHKHYTESAVHLHDKDAQFHHNYLGFVLGLTDTTENLNAM